MILNITDAQRATVEDSLSDYIDAQENAAAISGEAFAALYMAIAIQALRVRESFRANADLSEADLGAIEYALEASYENCVALGLTDAADDYSAVSLAIFGER